MCRSVEMVMCSVEDRRAVLRVVVLGADDGMGKRKDKVLG